MKLGDALIAYKVGAKAEGKSPKTISWVLSACKYFAQFLGGEDKEVEPIIADDLRRFILALQGKGKFSHHPFNQPQNQNLSPQTILTCVLGIKSLFSFLHREGFIPFNPMAKVKGPKVARRVVPTFTEREMERLLQQPDKARDEGYRDYAILLTLIDTGIRLSELCGLGEEDVDLENGHLKVMGKGGKERHVPIGLKLTKVLLKYKLKHRPEPPAGEAFFLTHDGRPLSPWRIQKLVRKYGQRAGLKKCYPHKLRHTSAVLYLRNGGDPFTLQRKLGHSTLAMTRHYSNLADADVKRVHMRASPGDKLRA